MSEQPNDTGSSEPHVTHTDPPVLVTPPAAPAAPQQPAQQPPAQSPAPQQNGPQNGGTDLSGLTQQIAALPEQIVSAIREAVQPPKAPEQPAATPPANGGGHSEPGKPKSFAEWWFGK